MGAFAHGLRDRAGWEVVAFVRAVVVLVLCSGMVYSAGVRIHVWRPAALWVRSIAGSLSMVLVFYSLSRLPVSIVVTLMNLAPVWVAIVSWFWLPQTRSRWIWVIIAIGLVGVMLIQQPQLAQGNLAVLAPLVSSFLLAVVMLALHRAQQVDTRAVVLHFSVISSLTCLIVFLYAAHRAPLLLVADTRTVLMLLGTGVTAGAGQLFLTAAFAAGPPAKVSVVSLTQVGFALLYDVLLWGHSFSPLSLIGIVLVVLPTALLLWANRQGLAAIVLRTEETS